MKIVLLLKSQPGLFDTLVPVKASVAKDGTVRPAHMAVRHKRPKPVAPAHHAAQATGDLFADAPPAPKPAEPKPAPRPEPEVEAAQKREPEKPAERHKYGLTMRAADASALPDGYIAGSHHDSDKYKFGTVEFSRKLTAAEIDRFDLVDVKAKADQADRNAQLRARIDANPALAKMVDESGVSMDSIDDALLDELEAEIEADEKPAPAPDAEADKPADIPGLGIVGKVNYDGPFDPDKAPDFGVAAGVSKETRRQINSTAAALSVLPRGNLTDTDIQTLRQYSGNGGCGDSLNEYYTDPKVAMAMWQVLRGLGVTQGEVLEPSCATGVFMETAPSNIKVQGVELDGTSARIAELLHPQHAVENASLEGFATTDTRQFDAVIGNAPFGLRGSLLSQDKKDLKTAEAYFLDTSLDKTKPGGIVAMIVPTGVMDSGRDRKVRERLLRKAEFLGAMRMPNTAFEHSHTGVTTDVVFFRKRPEDVAGALATVDRAVLKALGVWDDEFLSGGYFEGRGAPNVCGTMGEGWRAKAGMGDDITVDGSMDGVPQAIAEFEPETPEAASPTVAEILEAIPDETGRERARAGAVRKPYDTAKRGATKMIDGVQYILEGEPLRWHRVDEFLGSKPVADAVLLSELIERAMTDDGYAEANDLQAKVKAYVDEHGVPSKNPDLMIAAASNRQLYRLIGAVKPDGSFSDIVTGRKAAVVESSFDAAAATLALENGQFLPEQVAARWSEGDRETVLDHLYASPEYALLPGGEQWTSVDQYLSGELWPALDLVRETLERDDLKPEDRAKFERQAKLLEDTIDPRSLEDVEVALNSAFLPLDVLAAFFNEKAQAAGGYFASRPPLRITFEKGIYTLAGGGYDTGLLGKYLNRTGVRQEDDMPTIDRWNADFKVWLCGSKYRDQVEELYNRTFRGFRQREYSNTPFEVPGLKADGLKDYQWGGVRWALEAGKGIIAADVGLGKTARALIVARMLKVTGRAKKPIIVVPKSVLANWCAEAEKWFPGASVLTIGETYSRDKKGNLKARQDTAAERNRKLHDLTQNDYDFVLISQPAWNDIDLDPATKKQYTDDDFWVQRGDSLGNAGDKRINAIRERYNQSLAAREFEKRTDAIYFNDLGVDAIISDEMHAYKNLYAAKNRFGQQPKFLGGQGLSNRALDMSLKARWIRENNGGNNVFGLTATPTKNSPLEIYSMLSHIAPEAFERVGIRNSEEFLDRFCEFKEENILTTTGGIDRALVTVGFKNLDELRQIMRRYIDRTTAEQVGLVLPARDDRQHLVDMTAEQHAVYSELREKAEEAKGKDATGDAHIFSVMDKMAKAAMDLELYDPKYAGSHSPKYAAAVGQIALGAAEGGQVVFIENIDAHERIAGLLAAAGIPRDQIGIISGKAAPSSAMRQNISDAFNAGKLKVVICNKTAEEGVNLQKGTTDIHHLDLPWEPAAFQQRNGRGLRQGNLSEAVRIHTYLAKGSFDGYRHQSMRAKKDWQDLLWNGGDRVENLAREGALSRDDLMIMLSADPDKAREDMAKNKAQAQAQYEAQQTQAVVEDFNRFRDMKASLTALKDKTTPAAERLAVRVARLRTQLEASPWFKAKEALDSDKPMVLLPNSGIALQEGTAFEVDPGEGSINGGGKFVVSRVSVHPTLGQVVHARRYGSASSHPAAFELKDLQAGVKTFDYDAGAEQAEINKALASGLSDKPIKGYADLQGLPSAVISGAYAAIQKQVKDAAIAYKFDTGYGAVGLVSGGKAVLSDAYGSRQKLDDHDLMLPTDEHREAAMTAYLEAERGKSFGFEYRAGNRRSSQSDQQFVIKYRDHKGYSNQGSNPWGSIGDKVFGGGFSKVARERFEREQMRAASKATTLKESIAALAPTVSGAYSGAGPFPKKAMAMMWARARRQGVLDDKMAAHIPAMQNYGELFKTPPKMHGYQPVPVGERSVREVLTDLAKHHHPDLAAAMLTDSADPEAALKDMVALPHAPAIRDGIAHMIQKNPHLADRPLADFGRVEGPRRAHSWGSTDTPAHPLHAYYGPKAENWTLRQLVSADKDIADD